MRLFGLDIKRATKAIPAAPDADRAAVLSEPTPAEQGKPTPTPDYGTDAELVALVNERVKLASHCRRVAEREWVLSVAMYEGRQWLAWDTAEHRAISLMDDDERDRYVTHNLIEPLVDKIIGLSTKSKPDANPAPQSDSEADRAAAAEAASITAHLSRKYARATQMLDASFWATICGVSYTKEYWDKGASADVAVPDPATGQMTRRSAKVGEVRSEITPPFEVLLDPRAKRYDRAAWLVHYRTALPSELVESYGKPAENIEPDSFGGSGYTDAFMPDSGADGGLSSLGVGAGGGAKSAIKVMECWEKPTKRFPDGRLIVSTKTALLYAGPNPLAGTPSSGFPFARLAFQEAADHPYGLGMVSRLAPLQVNLNRLLTKATTEIEDNKNTLVRQIGDEMGADAYAQGDEVTEKRNFRTVHSRPGFPATWQAQPPVTADVWRLVDLVWLHMQHIAGIHDVNMGTTTGGLTAGISIEMLQQGDQTQLALFTQRIEQYSVDRDTLDIALYAKYAGADVPRMMGLDDSGNPGEARSRIVAFRALTGGGNVAVIVTPGSATPKSAAGQTQEILEFFKLGLFDPMSPAAEIAVRLLSIPKSDQVVRWMQTARADAEQKAQAMQAQQQLAQAAQAQQQAELQAQLQAHNAQVQAASQPPPAPPVQPPPPPPDPAQVSALKIAEQSHQAQARMIEQNNQHSQRLSEAGQKAALDSHQKMLDAALKLRLAKETTDRGRATSDAKRK